MHGCSETNEFGYSESMGRASIRAGMIVGVAYLGQALTRNSVFLKR